MLGSCLDRVRERAPLIHCITNFVTANDVANLLLACGASPIMACDPREVEEVAARSAALVLNLGTLSHASLPAMAAAGRRAAALGRPVVLDPVGAGFLPARTRAARELLDQVPFAAVRGNLSEIRALTGRESAPRGVDAGGGDRFDREDRAAAFAREAARQLGTVAAVTGETDLVSDGTRCFLIRNGRPEMGRVTGTGCQLSALTAAFLAADPHRPLEGAAAAVCAMGLAGELAWGRMAPGEGNASYRTRIIDAVFLMDGNTLDKGARYEIG